MSHRLVISKIVKTNCVSLINYFKTPTNANTNLPLLVCENIRNHSINNFELNFDTITQNRAQANGEQPAANWNWKFCPRGCQLVEATTSHKTFVLRAKQMAPSHQLPAWRSLCVNREAEIQKIVLTLTIVRKKTKNIFSKISFRSARWYNKDERKLI